MKTSLSRRKTPSQERSQATVDAILEAAAQIFGKTDFESVTTRAVAEHAGVSIGSFYQYFPNKLALLETVRERHIKNLWEAIGSACLEARAMPWPEALRHVVASGILCNVRNISLFSMLQRTLPTQIPAGDRMIVAKSVYGQHLRTFFSSHRSSLRVDLDKAVSMTPVLARGIFTATLSERPEDLKNYAVIDELTSILLGYLT